MPKSKPPYSLEFRQQIVELVRSGRPIADLAREFEPSSQTIHAWVKQADRDPGKRTDILSSSERDELRRLRKENRQLRQEREITTHRRWVGQRPPPGSLGRPMGRVPAQ